MAVNFDLDFTGDTKRQFFLFVLTLILIGISIADKPFHKATEKFSNFLEPNVKSVGVECFGNEDNSMMNNDLNEGYWGGHADQPTRIYSTGPPVGGTQSTAYQLYQQAVNAATPTLHQLELASNMPGGGYGYIDTPEAPGIVPPAGDDTFYDAAAVNFGNRRQELISPCAQNAPTFVASSLLPKTNLPGQESWNVYDTKALANQNFLSATQRVGVDTVLSSNKNPSYDIRNNIPNPIYEVSPWYNSSITPDQQRRPLDGYVPENGIYGAGMSSTYGPTGRNQNNMSKPPLGHLR